MADVPNQISDILNRAKDIFSNVTDIVQTVDSVYDQIAVQNLEVPPGIVNPVAGQVEPAPGVSYSGDTSLNTTTLLIGGGVLLGLILILKVL